MTIHMEEVYKEMANAYSKQIEQTLLDGNDHFKITFEDFRLKMKGAGIIGNKQTAKEKWENMMLDGVTCPLGTKGKMAVLQVRELLAKVHFYGGEKNKKKYFSSPKAEVKA